MYCTLVLRVAAPLGFRNKYGTLCIKTTTNGNIYHSMHGFVDVVATCQYGLVARSGRVLDVWNTGRV